MNVPTLTAFQKKESFQKAASSDRRRYPVILHKPGDEFNRVFNFMLEDSYMQPHLHPGKEKIEKMYLVQGRFAVIFFDDTGYTTDSVLLEKGGIEYCEIPAYAFHTYVMLSDEVISYETMMGVYDPKTWKQPAQWAPGEGSPEGRNYLEFLKQQLKSSN